MFLNRLWPEWQKHLHLFLSGSVMVTIESQWFSNETHCEQGPGNSLLDIIYYYFLLLFFSAKTLNLMRCRKRRKLQKVL